MYGPTIWAKTQFLGPNHKYKINRPNYICLKNCRYLKKFCRYPKKFCRYFLKILSIFFENFVDIFWKFCRYFLKILSIFFENFVDIFWKFCRYFQKNLSIFSKKFVDIFKKICRYFRSDPCTLQIDKITYMKLCETWRILRQTRGRIFIVKDLYITINFSLSVNIPSIQDLKSLPNFV